MVNFKNKRVLIAGRGISGQGAYTALTELGAVCKYSDETHIASFGAELIVVSPGIDGGQPIFTYAAENKIPIIGELELGYILCDKPIIAITGTNGKTTVTKLIGLILDKAGYKAAVCGNVGESFALTAYKGGFDYAVVEASSFQLETINAFRPHVAVITNISPDHLNRHKTMSNYCAEKKKIAKNQTRDDFLVLCQDDIPLYALENFAPQGKTYYTSLRGKLCGAYVYEDYIYYMCEKICSTNRVRLEGSHNIKNVLAAVCVAKILNIDNSAVISAITEFAPDSHRLRLVAHSGGKNYYNDSKGTNIMASVFAAECMAGDTCMIVGGSDKGYEYDEFFNRLPGTIVRVAAVGDTANKVKAAAERCGFVKIKTFNDFAEAFKWADSGDETNVLLSPASASFDMFSSYSERGEAFERLVADAVEK